MVASDSCHTNLFDGLADFSSLGGAQEESKKYKKDEAEDGGSKKSKKQRREERPSAVSPEDEKYKLGYGLVEKGVKALWYLSRSSSLSSEDVGEGIKGRSSLAIVDEKNGGKKMIEELREERKRREKQEKRFPRSPPPALPAFTAGSSSVPPPSLRPLGLGSGSGYPGSIRSGSGTSRADPSGIRVR